jgi:hypothetical protein
MKTSAFTDQDTSPSEIASPGVSHMLSLGPRRIYDIKTLDLGLHGLAGRTPGTGPNKPDYSVHERHDAYSLIAVE